MTQDQIEEALAFQVHEMGGETKQEQHWLAWVDVVEKLYGGSIDLDGNVGDGVCLDWAYEDFEKGLTPEAYLNGRRH